MEPISLPLRIKVISLHLRIRSSAKQFFAANPDILLYICETGDGKQAFRSRLFVRWFNTYNRRADYVMQTAEVQDGKTRNFAALIVQKSNPRLEEILSEFNETISILTNKPE